MKTGFDKIKDHRPCTIQHSLGDTLMSGFSMFSLKDPSLPAFDERRIEAPHNLMTIYGMGSIPCDTSMREILDGVDPNDLRPLFKGAFRQLQRGKALEQMVFMQGYYLLNLDGTGYFSSSKLYSNACMEKHHRNGKVTYYLQAVGAAIVHPDFKEVLPLCPEIIRKQDGETKMDCERNATKRFLERFRRDHPHLKVIVNVYLVQPCRLLPERQLIVVPAYHRPGYKTDKNGLLTNGKETMEGAGNPLIFFDKYLRDIPVAVAVTA